MPLADYVLVGIKADSEVLTHYYRVLLRIARKFELHPEQEKDYKKALFNTGSSFYLLRGTYEKVKSDLSKIEDDSEFKNKPPLEVAVLTCLAHLFDKSLEVSEQEGRLNDNCSLRRLRSIIDKLAFT